MKQQNGLRTPFEEDEVKQGPCIQPGVALNIQLAKEDHFELYKDKLPQRGNQLNETIQKCPDLRIDKQATATELRSSQTKLEMKSLKKVTFYTEKKLLLCHKRLSMTQGGVQDQMEKQKQLTKELKGKKVGLVTSFIMRNREELDADKDECNEENESCLNISSSSGSTDGEERKGDNSLEDCKDK